MATPARGGLAHCYKKQCQMLQGSWDAQSHPWTENYPPLPSGRGITFGFFWAGRCHDPLAVTVARLLCSGDIETNPGPSFSKLPKIEENEQKHKIKHSSDFKLKLLQIKRTTK